jgi:hypothetical protein
LPKMALVCANCRRRGVFGCRLERAAANLSASVTVRGGSRSYKVQAHNNNRNPRQAERQQLVMFY